MCIYRIRVGKAHQCGKRIPLSCQREVCPFGPRKWEYLVRHGVGEARYFWVYKKSGEIERVEDAEEAVNRVRRGEGEYVVKGIYYRLLGVERTVKFPGLRKCEKFEAALKLTRFADVHLEGEHGRNTVVAIIDSGVSGNAPVHEKISLHEASILNSENHGGIIHEIIHELVPEARIVFVQILGQDIPDYLLINALKECEKRNVHAVNFSIQSEVPSDGGDPLSCYINYLAREKRVCTVVAAGNGGPINMSIGSPGAAEQSITVGACSVQGKLLRYSSRGPTLDGRFKPDLVAPSNFVFQNYFVRGTSFSVPFVVSAAAVLNRDLGSAVATRRILHLSARPIPVTHDSTRLVVYRRGYRSSTQAGKDVLKIFGDLVQVLADSRNHVGAGVLDVKNALDIKDELVSEIKAQRDEFGA